MRKDPTLPSTVTSVFTSGRKHLCISWCEIQSQFDWNLTHIVEKNLLTFGEQKSTAFTITFAVASLHKRNHVWPAFSLVGLDSLSKPPLFAQNISTTGVSYSMQFHSKFQRFFSSNLFKANFWKSHTSVWNAFACFTGRHLLCQKPSLSLQNIQLTQIQVNTNAATTHLLLCIAGCKEFLQDRRQSHVQALGKFPSEIFQILNSNTLHFFTALIWFHWRLDCCKFNQNRLTAHQCEASSAKCLSMEIHDIEEWHLFTGVSHPEAIECKIFYAGVHAWYSCSKWVCCVNGLCIKPDFVSIPSSQWLRVSSRLLNHWSQSLAGKSPDHCFTHAARTSDIK